MNVAFEKEYFAQNYRDYAKHNPPAKMRFYGELVESAAPQRAERRILDVGCAFGTFLGSLDDRWRKYGLDQSQHAIEHARENLPQGTFAVGSAIEIPFDEQFDAICSFDCLEHVEDLEAVRSNIIAHLAGDGAFVFVVPVYDGPTGPIIHFLDRDPTHVHKRDRWFWLSWAERSFEIREWWGVYRYLLPGGIYAHLPTRRFRRWTPAIAVVASRREGPADGNTPTETNETQPTETSAG